MTIQDTLRRAIDFLAQNGIDEAQLDAEVLLAHVLKMHRLYLYVHLDLPLSDKAVEEYKTLLHHRAARIPVSQLVGSKEFMGLEFNVTSDVLTPRPETEILVQNAVEIMNKMNRPLRIADIGTGSGAIVISVLHYIDNATADAVDVSHDAIAVAKANAQKFNVADRITFHEGDLFAPIKDKKFDAILSNPPYIPSSTINELAPEVADHEPRLALDGGADGLDICRRIINDGTPLLESGGFLAFEVGINQVEPVKRLLDETQQFNNVDVIRDLGGIDRIIVAYKK